MQHLRRVILRTARRLGLEPRLRRAQRALARGAKRRGYVDDEHTRLLLALAVPSGSTCVDVGANVGAVLEDIVRTLPDGRHVAFEPLPDLAANLRRRFPTVDVREVALSDRTGTATFTRNVSRPARSALGDVDAAGAAVEQLEVRVQPLDDALPGDLAPAFIKVDVEGAEEQVFRGMLRTLREHRPIVVFEHGDHAARFGTSSGDIHDLLCGAAGLRLFDIDGNGPFTRTEFAARVADGGVWTWVARS